MKAAHARIVAERHRDAREHGRPTVVGDEARKGGGPKRRINSFVISMQIGLQSPFLIARGAELLC